MTTVKRIRLLCYIGSLDAGGAERQMITLLKHIDRAAFEPLLLLAHRQGALLSEVPEDIPVLCATPEGQIWPGMSRWRRVQRLARILQEQRIDLVYDRTYLATLDTAMACWLRPTPRVSAAVADPAIQFRLYAKAPRGLWYRFSRWAYRTATRVLANSEGLRRQLLDFWQLPEAHVLTQPNAYDFEWIESQASTAQPNVLPRKVLLTVGRIDADKGHADLWAAIEKLVPQSDVPAFLWRIVGTGPALQDLQRAVREKHLESNVEFAGVVASPYVEYRRADLFCLPSHTEGLPNVLIEALACGTPVLSTDCPSGPREILAAGTFGRLVPVGDVDALATAIRSFLIDPMPWQEQATLGQIDIRQRYGVKTVIPRLEKIFQEAAATSNSQQR